jgi:membrane-bound lytic murein transglycosylase F
MQQAFSHLLRTARRAHPGVYVLLAFLLAALAAPTRRPLRDSAGGADLASTSQPIERDLAAIEKDGKLRVLLSDNATSYHVIGGIEYGFEYELAQNFADEQGLSLEVALAGPRTPAELLSSGAVDLIAIPLSAPNEANAAMRYTRPYDDVALVVVTSGDSLGSLADLHQRRIAARQNSRGHHALLELRARGIDVHPILMLPQESAEEILQRVADGELDAAVVSENIARAVHSYREELRIAYRLEAEMPVRWAVRSNSPKLLESVDAYLLRHRRQRPDGTIARSQLHNVLRRKYFSDRQQIRSRAEDPFALARTGRLSPYDDDFRRIAGAYGVDWRLVASIAFQESRFDPMAVSFAGAVGLLQLIPRTAGIAADELHDPLRNIELGVRHFRGLYESYSYLPPDQRLRFALAAYNCGGGHLEDARILALQRGDDPNDFELGVAPNLLRLQDPRHYAKARYGYVRGTETVGYVREVMRRYELFTRILDALEATPPAELAQISG